MNSPFFSHRRIEVLSALLIASTATLGAADVETDWAQVTALDAGPKVKATSQAEARQVAMKHLADQERAVRGFIGAHPTAPQAFEGRLRLSRILQIRADFEKNDRLRVEAQKWLDDADAIATPEQRVEADFARVTFIMRAQRAAGQIEAKPLLDAVRGFQAKYPEDRRLATLLVEVATLFDSQPRTKRALLSDAEVFAKDDQLKSRIADDLKRLDLLGHPVPLKFTSLQGKAVDLSEQKGKVTMVIFFAQFSPPAVAAFGKVKQAAAQFPKEPVQVVGVSLDQSPEATAKFLKEQGVAWPVSCDGKGWASPLVRSLGINTLPTVWLIDQQGRLRALNALDSLVSQTRQLIAEK